MNLLILIPAGLILGHLVRRFTPHMLGMTDRTLPFNKPYVELIAALAFALVGLRLGLALPQWKWYLFCLFLLAVGSADGHTKYIPSLVCYIGTAVGIIVNGIWPDDVMDLLGQYDLLQLIGVNVHQAHRAGLILGVSGALMGYLLIEFIRRVFKPIVQVEVMGAGDAILMLMIGAFIGPRAVVYGLLPACIVGLIMGGIQKLATGSPHFAFGPSLAIGGLLMLLYGEFMLVGIQGFYDFIANLPPMVPLLISVVLVIVLLLMLLRLRRKAAEYERLMDEEYAETDKKMQSK